MILDNQRNVECTPVFDTYTANAGALPSKIVLFSAATDGTKGREKTNLTRPYQLQPGELLRCTGMRWVPIGMGLVDIEGIIKNYTMQLLVGRDEILDAPPDYWNGGAGITGATTQNAQSVFSNGVADPRATPLLNPPVLIDGNAQFQVQLIGTAYTAIAGVFFRVYLEGQLEKLVG